jgi:hypothetical protein
MIQRHHLSSKKPPREPWTKDTLICECAVALTNTIDRSTSRTYGSALNSWIAFAEMHDFATEPTVDTLTFYIVYMSHHISPRSVKTYLSGLVHQLEPDFPSIRQICSSRFVAQVMRGCLKSRGTAVQRKKALLLDDLCVLAIRFQGSLIHDDFLFIAILLTGFHGLLCLGEMTFPDDTSIHDWRKVSKRSTVLVHRASYEFVLPGHKADKTFEGNRVVICALCCALNPCPLFSQYLSSRDHLFPASSPLWLTSSGCVPTRSYFLSRFRLFFPKSFAGASLRSGGATLLAMQGTPAPVIRAMGRWSSDAWEVYIRTHPSVLQALLHRC